MITISKGVLKAKMLKYFRHVEQTGEELVVTNNNFPTLKVIPITKNEDVNEVFTDLRGKISISDDIMKPEIKEWDLTDGTS